jgi:hypothetical protein
MPMENNRIGQDDNLGMTDIASVDLDMTDVPRVDLGMTDIASVDPGITNIARVDLGMTDIASVDPGMTDIARVDIGMTDIASVELGMTDTASVDLGMTDIASVPETSSNVGMQNVEEQMDYMESLNHSDIAIQIEPVTSESPPPQKISKQDDVC